MEGLRDFLATELRDTVDRVIDRPEPKLYENFVEGFVLETKRKISPEALLVVLERYYPNGDVTVRSGGKYYWVIQVGRTQLLLNITNHSELGGARNWGGNPNCGGIGIVVTKYP